MAKHNMAAAEIPDDKRKLYQRLIDTHPDIELLGAKKLSYTSVNGHMFSQMSKDGRLGLRLSQEDQAEFIKVFETIPFKNYEANIKDYVEVPTWLLEDTDRLAPYLAKSLAYTLTLKPK